MSSNIMIYGAGAIGRGFLAPIFNKLGYKISFVDKDVHLIKELEKRKCYTTAKTKEDKYEFQEVCVESSYLLGEESSALKKTDFVFSCVGPRNSSSLANRIKNVPCIISFENERDSANILKEKTNNPNCYFGLPDVITSSTASPELLRIDPLCTISEEGDLIIEKGNYKMPSEIRQVSVKELDMHWVCKLYLHNTPHAIVAYFGWKYGAKYIHEAMENPKIDNIVVKALDSIKETLIKLGLVQREFVNWYATKELKRFRNKLLFDPISRVAREPLRKLRKDDRLISAAKRVKEAEMDPYVICLGIRAALEYDNPNDKDKLHELRLKIGDEGILKNICQLKATDPLYMQILETELD